MFLRVISMMIPMSITPMASPHSTHGRTPMIILLHCTPPVLGGGMHAVHYHSPFARGLPSCYACGSSFPSYPQGMQGWETPMSDPYSSYEPSLIGNPESQTHSSPTGRDSVLTDFEDGKVGLPIRITCIPAAGLPSCAQKFRRGFPNPQFSRSDHSSP